MSPDAARAFAIPGELVSCEPLVRGHIHQTWVSTWRQPGGATRYLHQRMSEAVFLDIVQLMRNVEVVTAELARPLDGDGDEAGYQSLELVRTREGATWWQGAGGAWRTFHFIEGCVSPERCEGPEQAFAAARIFGWFQARLAKIDPARLGETIPRFFDSAHRWEQFEAALEAGDSAGGPDLSARREAAADAIEFALGQRELLDAFAVPLRTGAMPQRIIHGDTKLTNVLFDERSGRARCVVDLDTCMPGFSLYDFGDLVRFTAATSREDEPDPALAGTDIQLYRALRSGFLESAADALTSLERDLLYLAGPHISLVIGLRFLADHLVGDKYFQVHRPGQNLDRARVQFAQVAAMARMADEMRRG